MKKTGIMTALLMGLVVLLLLSAACAEDGEVVSPMPVYPGDPVPELIMDDLILEGTDPTVELRNAHAEGCYYFLRVYPGNITTLDKYDYKFDDFDDSVHEGEQRLELFGVEVYPGVHTVFLFVNYTDADGVWTTGICYPGKVITVLGNDNRPPAPAAAADQEEVMTGAPFSCTVETRGAEDMVCLFGASHRDENSSGGVAVHVSVEVTGDRTVFESSLPEAWEYLRPQQVSCSFAVKINGVWSHFSEQLHIRLLPKIPLGTPVIHAPEVIGPGEDLVFTVDPVPDAQQYRYTLLDAQENEIEDGSCDPGQPCVIPASRMQTGQYTLEVEAGAERWYEAGLSTVPVTVAREAAQLRAFVTRCYQIILNRAPDAGGLQTWVNALFSGRKAASEIIDGFVRSVEFQGKNYSHADAVEILYRAMLGRGSDPAGKANWVAKLEAGQPLAAVINGFCGSGEFRAICDSYGIRPGFVDVPEEEPSTPDGKIKAFVKRCYRIILGRGADERGLNDWFNYLKTRQKAASEIIDGFVRSVEFLGKNYSNEESVEILYKAMLGRGSDPAGKANWVAKLNAGQPLAAVINGFCGSQEFTGLCASYGIEPGRVQMPALSGLAEEEALSGLAYNAEEPITKRSEANPNRVSIINPSDTIDPNIGTAVQAVYINEEKAKEFVSRCYQYILGRSAGENELAGWVGQMTNGTKTADQIARGFLFSDEFKGRNVGNLDLVKTLYRVYLNRDADPAGLASWTAKLDSGMGLKELLDSLVKTGEYKNVISELGK